MEKFISEASFWVPESLVDSAWTAHAPFAFWLTDVHRPKLIVELGTHLGFSYFAFAQAVKRLQIKSRCVAVDTWKGDEHAGTYGDEVFDQVKLYNDAHYVDFSELMRCTFDEAVDSFEDGSIDLLHIDGRHFYEDVRHDFDTWKRKLSNRAVVLLHDTNVRVRSFGVDRLWEEVRTQYPNFEFLAGHGLGVLGLGSDLPQVIRDLFSLSNQPEARKLVREAYERLGAAVVDRARIDKAAAEENASLRTELNRQLSARGEIEETHRQLTGMYDQLKAAHDQLDGMYHRLGNERLELQDRYEDLEEQLKQREAECSRLQAERGSIEKLLEEARQADKSQFQSQLEQSASRLAELTATLAGREQELRNSQNATATAVGERDNKERELASRSAELNRLLSSRSWRLTAPLRSMGEKAPGVKTSVSKVLKLLWWIVTLQLSSRLQARRYKGLIESSDLFDRNYYLASNPDVAASGTEPITHYLLRGAHEGRNPHPIFDSAWYEKQNPDVTAAGINPLVHYLLQGWKEGRAPNPLFDLDYYFRGENEQARHVDPAAKHYLEVGWKKGLNPHVLFDGVWYLEQNPDISRSGLNPLAHYLDRGWKEKRSPHPLLNADWYLAQLPAEQGDKVVPPVHYASYGWRAGLTPHPLFDVSFYLEQNPDVSAAGIDPLEHYLSKGWQEGRDPHPLFDTDWYLKQYPDLEEARINPLVHYETHGAKEGRNPHPLFDAAWYLKQNPDVAESRTNPLIHFVHHGWKEGRKPNPWSDVGKYFREYPRTAESGLKELIDYLSSGEGVSDNPEGSRQTDRRKVVFVSGERHTPGHTYRIANVAAALPPRFFETIIVGIEELPNRWKDLRGADLVWIWRTTWSSTVRELINFVRKENAKIIFDVDDLMFCPELATTEVIDGIRSQHLREKDIREFYEGVQMVMGFADHCTAPTAVLAGEIRGFHKPTTVIPNGFNRTVLEASKRGVARFKSERDDEFVRIGYAAGTRTHQRDFKVASHAIAKTLENFSFSRLVLFKGTIELAEFPELARLKSQIEWRDCVAVEELPYEYARFDINIAPLEVGNRYCEAKSELKYFEAALVGVPTIASPTKPFEAAIRPGQTGFLARNDEEWELILDQLVRDPKTGKRAASEARREVLWNYGPERRHLLMTRLMSQVFAPPPERAHRFLPGSGMEGPVKLPVPVIPESEVLFEAGYRGLSRISVVIPLFNYEQFVSDALDSVLHQSMRDIDIIVVDDVSTDSSVEVARKWLVEHARFFNFVALLRNKENSKLGRTRNAAVAYCDTELFLPLDPDNLLLPDCVEKLAKELDETGAAFAYPTIELFGDRIGEMGQLEFDPALFRSGNYIDAMAMVRKACWLAVGGYAPLDPPGWEDYDFWCQLVEQGLTGTRAKKVLAKYRVHNSSMLHTTTELPTNKPRVIQELNERHPWLDLNVRTSAHQHNDDISSLHSKQDAEKQNIEDLLPILRCPETGEPLEMENERALVTASRSCSWPIVRGIPVFTPEGTRVTVQPEGHISNELPEEAIRLIRSCRGRVLNLSAGATAMRFDNVVELEYTIFKHTNVAGDVHRLPFQDEVFEAVVCINAFEHYREPDLAIEEIRRVLKPGGRLFMHTAFLQPLHESPHHYYNCTEFGLRQWLRNLSVDDIRVSENFNPIYGLSWLLSEMDLGFSEAGQLEAASLFRSGKVGEILSLWRDPATRTSPIWKIFHQLPHDIQRRFAAGWQATATKQIAVHAAPELSANELVISGGS